MLIANLPASAQSSRQIVWIQAGLNLSWYRARLPGPGRGNVAAGCGGAGFCFNRLVIRAAP